MAHAPAVVSVPMVEDTEPLRRELADAGFSAVAAEARGGRRRDDGVQAWADDHAAFRA